MLYFVSIGFVQLMLRYFEKVINYTAKEKAFFRKNREKALKTSHK